MRGMNETTWAHRHVQICNRTKHSAAKYINLFVYLVKKKKQGLTLSSAHDRKVNLDKQCYHDQMSEEARNQSWFR